MSGSPLITVVMPAYNAEGFIHRAINSVKMQTHRNWELIIVDDCSTDNTSKVIDEFCGRDKRIIYTKLPKNEGPAAARNVGFSAAKGDWITVLDSDDRYEPDRLEYLLTHANLHQADVVADNIIYYDESADKIIGKGFDLKQQSLVLTPIVYLRNCGTPLKFSLSLLKPFIRKGYLRAHQITYPNDLRVGEDFYFLFFLLWKGGKVVILNSAKYLYTMPYGAASKTLSKSSRTNHEVGGWDVIIASKRKLLQNLMLNSPQEKNIIFAIRQLETQYIREKAWRELKICFAKRSLGSAALVASKVNLAPFLWKKTLCKLRLIQVIKK